MGLSDRENLSQAFIQAVKNGFGAGLGHEARCSFAEMSEPQYDPE